MEELDAVALLSKTAILDLSEANQLMAAEIVKVSYYPGIYIFYLTFARNCVIYLLLLFKLEHSFWNPELLILIWNYTRKIKHNC
jgi:hypothetical protein